MATEDTRRRVGRPTKEPQDGERVPLGLRVTADMKRKLDDAAKDSGRSQSQEAELRLSQTFEREAVAKEVVRTLKPLLEKNSEEYNKVMREVAEAKAKLLELIAKSEAEDK